MNHAQASAEPPTSSGSTILKKKSFLVCARRTVHLRFASVSDGLTELAGLTVGRLAPIAAIATIRHTPPTEVNAVSHALVAGMIGSRSSASIGTRSASAKYGTSTSQFTSRLR